MRIFNFPPPSLRGMFCIAFSKRSEEKAIQNMTWQSSFDDWIATSISDNILQRVACKILSEIASQ